MHVTIDSEVKEIIKSMSKGCILENLFLRMTEFLLSDLSDSPANEPHSHRGEPKDVSDDDFEDENNGNCY